MESHQLSLFDPDEHPFVASILDLFPNSESDEIEYKLAEGGFPDEFWKTYSAFANTRGGVIVLGVKERKNEFIFEGLNPSKIGVYKKAFWDNANNYQKVSVNILVEQDVKEIIFEDKSFLAFRIPSASRVQRPVYITSNPFENTYKRNHEGDYRCTKEEVRRMLADADLSIHADSRILEGYSMDDFDLISVRQYRQMFANNRPGHIWLALNDKEFLTQLGAFRMDRKSKVEGVTVAGMLMFGKTNSITDPECCPNFFPDYREVLSHDPQIRWTDRIYPDGNWEANLFQFYRVVWPKLASSLPKPFQLKDGIRMDETPAHIALREAFVNALIHTDYTAPNNIVIEQRIDDYRFSNPGTLLVTIRQYYHGGTSECRNKTLQQLFLMIGSAEKAGSGVNKIIYGWEYAQWRRPYLIIESQPDRLILELPKFSILPEETLQTLRVLFGDNVEALGKDELNILAICHIEGEITNNRLQDSINKHRTDITKILQELCKEGYLLSDNKSRWTTYHLNIDFMNKMDGSTMDSSNMDGSTMDSSIKKKKTLKQSFEVLSSQITVVCQTDYKSVEEIANELKRSPKYLKNFILPKMLSTMMLQKKYPDYHPDQKYKAIQ